MSILVALFRRGGQPADGSVHAFWNVFAQQIEFAKSILGVLVALFRRGSQPPNGHIHVLWDILIQQIEPAESVLRK